MELDIFWLILAILAGTCVVAFGFIKKITEWHYVRKFGEKRHSLPPGDMGWPFIGNNRSYHQALNADDPDRYMNDLVKRFLFIFLKQTMYYHYCCHYIYVSAYLIN